MDSRLEKIIEKNGYRLSEETIKVLEEYLEMHPSISAEEFGKQIEKIADMK